jgi:hypothetical protein
MVAPTEKLSPYQPADTKPTIPGLYQVQDTALKDERLKDAFAYFDGTHWYLPNWCGTCRDSIEDQKEQALYQSRPCNRLVGSSFSWRGVIE